MGDQPHPNIQVNTERRFKKIKITDIRRGVGVFTPKPDKPVSFAALRERESLKKAGYALDSATLRVEGKFIKEKDAWFLISSVTGQRFAIVGDKVVDKLESSIGRFQGKSRAASLGHVVPAFEIKTVFEMTIWQFKKAPKLSTGAATGCVC